MCQFMCGDVKFKDFCKASIPKFDLSKNDSFVHWYKMFCSTCLQWGVWCPPYESAQEDSIHGKWWTLLPASVREKDAFMSGLIYTALNKESTFPNGSREQGAVEGCPPQAGYHAIYSLLLSVEPYLCFLREVSHVKLGLFENSTWCFKHPIECSILWHLCPFSFPSANNTLLSLFVSVCECFVFVGGLIVVLNGCFLHGVFY